jgi:hypothetical protein
MLAPGETGVALCISRDQRVARAILNYVEGTLEASPYLRSLIKNRTQVTIELANRVSIEVRPCNFKTLRGPTYISSPCMAYAELTIMSGPRVVSRPGRTAARTSISGLAKSVEVNQKATSSATIAI